MKNESNLKSTGKIREIPKLLGDGQYKTRKPLYQQNQPR